MTTDTITPYRAQIPTWTSMTYATDLLVSDIRGFLRDLR
jgi:hypothetical protein